MKGFIFKMSDALGYYNILQVAENADAETIKNRYRDLAKQWHPDYNHEAESTDTFQKISQAYAVLGDAKERQIYDILSLAYTKDNYPDLDVIEPKTGTGQGTALRIVSYGETIAWGISFKHKQNKEIVDFSQALKLSLKNGLINWLFGWWHPKAFFVNIKSLLNNFHNPVSKEESLRLLLHNMIAYAKANKVIASAQCGLQAKKMLTEQSAALDKFLSELQVKAACPKDWQMSWLRAMQVIVPVTLCSFIVLILIGNNFKDSSLWERFSKPKEIDYYQKVNFGNSQSVDDVIVGKILSIPVDKTDTSKLYHVTETVKVMYGPSDDFDVIKTIKENTTVRLTGLTPDNIWARIMIDNGEVGFLHYDILKQGIGREIPFGSALIE